MGVHAEEERPRDAARAAVLHEGLARGEDVVLVEAAPERRAAVARRAEGHALARVRWVGPHHVVGGDETRDVHEEGSGGGLSGELVQGHGWTSGCRPIMPRAILCRMDWARLVELVGRVRATPKKSEKVALIADLLRQTRGRETALVALYLTGTLPQGRIGVGWKTLEPALPSGPAAGEPLTLARLDEVLSAVAAETGPGSAERRLRLLRALLEATDEAGRRLLVELLLGEVRQGALEGLVIEAIARAASLAPADVRAAAMFAPEPGRAGPRRARGGGGGPRALLAAAPVPGGADAGEPGRRRGGGARAPRRGRVRVQARRRAAAGPPRGRRGARLHPAAAGRDGPRARGGRVGASAARAGDRRRGRGAGPARGRAAAPVPGDDAPARPEQGRRGRPPRAAALVLLLRRAVRRGRGPARRPALRRAGPAPAAASSLPRRCCRRSSRATRTRPSASSSRPSRRGTRG